MKKVIIILLVIALIITGWIIFNNWRNRPERFIAQISAVAKFTAKTEQVHESTENELAIRKEALQLFPEWWPKGKLD